MHSESPNSRTSRWPTLSAELTHRLAEAKTLPLEPRLQALEHIRRDIERDYCAKPGVRDDDIAYCGFYQSGTCGYHNAIRRVSEELGVNLITGTVRADASSD